VGAGVIPSRLTNLYRGVVKERAKIMAAPLSAEAPG
jgi:hypothetical protein